MAKSDGYSVVEDDPIACWIEELDQIELHPLFQQLPKLIEKIENVDEKTKE